jgi:hypothetical protein
MLLCQGVVNHLSLSAFCVNKKADKLRCSSGELPTQLSRGMQPSTGLRFTYRDRGSQSQNQSRTDTHHRKPTPIVHRDANRARELAVFTHFSLSIRNQCAERQQMRQSPPRAKLAALIPKKSNKADNSSTMKLEMYDEYCKNKRRFVPKCL